jgi:hypothetical protein
MPTRAIAQPRRPPDLRRYRGLLAIVLLAPTGCLVVGQQYFIHDPLTDESGTCGGFQLSQVFRLQETVIPSTRILPEAMVLSNSPIDAIEYSIGANVVFSYTYVGAGACYLRRREPEGITSPAFSSFGGYVCWGLGAADDYAVLGLLVRYVFGTDVETSAGPIDGDCFCLGSQFKWKFLTPFCVSPPATIAS